MASAYPDPMRAPTMRARRPPPPARAIPPPGRRPAPLTELRRGTALLAACVALASTAAQAAPPALDLPPESARARAAAIRARFGRGPAIPLGPGPEVRRTPRFAFVSDRTRTLPGVPWMTDAAYGEAFELARAGLALPPDSPVRLLVVFSTFRDGGQALFYTALANDVEGLGIGDPAEVFDASPDSQLEGYAWMGAVDALEEGGPSFPEEAFLHEIGHRWLAYPALDHPELPPDALQGRNGAHWSFFAHTGGSPMEGNDWRPNGDGTWTTGFETPHRPRFSPLDLYFMGLARPEAVPPFVVLAGTMRFEPRWFAARSTAPPAHRLGVPVTVQPSEVYEVRMEHVLSALGPRHPPAADPAEPVALPIAVVLLDDARTFPGPEALAAFDARLAGWIDAFARATGGRMVLDARLPDAGRTPLGEACDALTDCDLRQADRCTAVDPGLPICTRGCRRHADCGAGGCCVEAPDGLLCAVRPACGPEPEIAEAGGGDGPADAGGGAPPPVDDGRPPPASPGCRCLALDPRGSPGVHGPIGALGLVLLAAGSVRARRRMTCCRRPG